MSWIIGILTFFLFVDCLLLILLVLVQLPKKEAGIGQAFGGAATDALFGAGSGNALTKLTKYATVAFFTLTMSISVLYGHHNRNKGGDFRQFLSEAERAQALPGQPGRTNVTAAAAAAISNLATGPVEKAVAPGANTPPIAAPTTNAANPGTPATPIK